MGVSGPFPKLLIFEMGRNDHLWYNPQFLKSEESDLSFFKNLVPGNISPVAHDFEHLTQESESKMVTSKKACTTERLVPCYFGLRFDCTKFMQSVKLCISRYRLGVTVFAHSAHMHIQYMVQRLNSFALLLCDRQLILKMRFHF